MSRRLKASSLSQLLLWTAPFPVQNTSDELREKADSSHYIPVQGTIISKQGTNRKERPMIANQGVKSGFAIWPKSGNQAVQRGFANMELQYAQNYLSVGQCLTGAVVVNGEETFLQPIPEKVEFYELTKNGLVHHTVKPEGFSYAPGFLTSEEQSALLQQLGGLHYQHDVFRGRQPKRESAQFGYTYVSSSRRIVPAPAFPEFLGALVKKGLPHCPEGTSFDQCVVTRYPHGSGIGWHTDSVQFGDCIMGVSLGAEARLLFRTNGSKEVSYEERVDPASLYVMRGSARWTHQHRVLPVKAIRYSLTFRRVADGRIVGDKLPVAVP